MKKLALRPLALGLLILAAAAALPGRAHARFVFTLQQVGTDIVLSGSGTLNTTALTLGSPRSYLVSQINATSAFLLAGGTQANQSPYTGGGLTGPTVFGTGPDITTRVGFDSLVGIIGKTSTLLTPVGYVSGSALTSGATFSNATFATLGFTPGTYTYTWGAGANADSLVLTSDVPEPSTWAAVALGAAGLGVVTLRRRSAVRA